MTPAALTLTLTVSEADFTTSVIEQAQLLGWRTAHFRAARVQRGDKVSYRTPVQGDAKGWPDLVLLREGTFIVAELKSERGVLEIEQVKWLDVLADAGAYTYVWRPSVSDEILNILKNLQWDSSLLADTAWWRCRAEEIARMPKRVRDALAQGSAPPARIERGARHAAQTSS